MPVDAPKIYPMDKVKLVEQIQKLAFEYCSSECLPEAWKDLSSIQSDEKADALINIFARMMEIIIHRLNKVPDKNFLTFLDLIGVSLSPPRSARVPLTFTMASGANKYGLIPAWTQVATAETAGQEAVVFETEKALTVILPKLVKAVSLSPADDKWTDNSQVLFNNTGEVIELFRGKNLISHRLYLGQSKLFSFKEETAITLDLDIKIPTGFQELDKWQVKWYYFDEKSVPKILDIEKTEPSDQNVIDWEVVNLLKSGSITFKPVAGISEKTLSGIEKEKNQKNNWVNNWIFAELSTPIPAENLPTIDTVNATVNISSKSSIVPDLAFFNNFPLDLSKDFYPYGERPKFNDTFYIGSKEAFSKKDAAISMIVTLSTGVDAPLASEKRKICWESWNGSDWETVSVKTKDDPPIVNYDFAGKKGEKKIVTFTCPNIEEKEINGEKSRWIRVRISEGDYGQEARYEEAPTFKGSGTISYSKEIAISGKETHFLREIRIGDSIVVIKSQIGTQTRTVTSIASDNSLTIDSPFSDINETEFYIKKIGWTYIPATYKPPSISELTLQYSFSSKDIPEIILTYNNFAYHDETKKPFTPFQPVADTQPALYLAFDQDISTLPVTIFFPLIRKTISTKKAPVPLNGTGTISSNNITLTGTGTNFKEKFKVGDSIAATGQVRTVIFISSDISLNVDSPFNPALQVGTKFSYTSSHEEVQNIPFLIWQYWTGKEWNKLKIEDSTNNLTKRELIQFLAPADVVKRSCFGFELEHYWIRVVIEKGNYDDFPIIKAIYTNTVWAHNMVTVKDEILGFSNGKPDQTFSFSQSPILRGQKVLVRELSLSEEGKRTIISEEGDDAIEEITDEAGDITGSWVRWHEVKNFYFSKPNSRHYIIDLNNGNITFGNGERGMIPPAGKNNIKCSYQAGGGVKGNVQAGTITKLRTTFPYIDSVTNHETASGGDDKENLDRVRERGPQTLKHRDRAVTYEDFEWLVREASSGVAKVKCLPTRDTHLQLKPGWVTLIMVPESDDPKPLPDQQLVNEIETYLFERTSSYLTTYPSQINLIGPGYIQVWVDACVHFTSITEAKSIERRILDNLQQFFHPLHGGPEKNGWDFGRNVYISEVYELIENTEGVDYVDDLILGAAIQIYKLESVAGTTLKASYPEHSTVDLENGKIIFLLAETLPEKVEIDEFYVVGFKEGDQVKISDKNENYISTFIVKSVLNYILECETEVEVSIPAGSIVETSGGIRSYTKADSVQKLDQSNSISLTVAIPCEISSDTEITLKHRDNQTINAPLNINKITTKIDTIFIEENYLVYSGTHTINKLDRTHPCDE